MRKATQSTRGSPGEQSGAASPHGRTFHSSPSGTSCGVRPPGCPTPTTPSCAQPAQARGRVREGSAGAAVLPLTAPLSAKHAHAHAACTGRWALPRESHALGGSRGSSCAAPARREPMCAPAHTSSESQGGRGGRTDWNSLSFEKTARIPNICQAPARNTASATAAHPDEPEPGHACGRLVATRADGTAGKCPRLHPCERTGLLLGAPTPTPARAARHGKLVISFVREKRSRGPTNSSAPGTQPRETRHAAPGAARANGSGGGLGSHRDAATPLPLLVSRLLVPLLGFRIVFLRATFVVGLPRLPRLPCSLSRARAPRPPGGRRTGVCGRLRCGLREQSCAH